MPRPPRLPRRPDPAQPRPAAENHVAAASFIERNKGLLSQVFRENKVYINDIPRNLDEVLAELSNLETRPADKKRLIEGLYKDLLFLAYQGAEYPLTPQDKISLGRFLTGLEAHLDNPAQLKQEVQQEVDEYQEGLRPGNILEIDDASLRDLLGGPGLYRIEEADKAQDAIVLLNLDTYEAVEFKISELQGHYQVSTRADVPAAAAAPEPAPSEAAPAAETADPYATVRRFIPVIGETKEIKTTVKRQERGREIEEEKVVATVSTKDGLIFTIFDQQGRITVTNEIPELLAILRPLLPAQMRSEAVSPTVAPPVPAPEPAPGQPKNPRYSYHLPN